MSTMYIESGGKIYQRDEFEALQKDEQLQKITKAFEVFQKKFSTSNESLDAFDVEGFFKDKEENLQQKRRKLVIPEPLNLENYSAVKVQNQIHYYRNGDASDAAHIAFKDCGKSVAVGKDCNEDDLNAALALANHKFATPGINVMGNDEFKQKCALLAAKNGYNVTNPELQDIIQKHKADIEYPDAFRTRPDAENSYGEESYDDVKTQEFATPKC